MYIIIQVKVNHPLSGQGQDTSHKFSSTYPIKEAMQAKVLWSELRQRIEETQGADR